MGSAAPYISRPQVEEFLAQIQQAVSETDRNAPRVFQVWGMGGVGKSRVLTEAETELKGKAHLVRVYFGQTEEIEAPLQLMAHVAEALPKEWGCEFTELYRLYRETQEKLSQEPVQKGKGITAEQKNAAQILLDLGLGWVQRGMPEEKAKEWDEAGKSIMEGAVAVLTVKDEVADLLKSHWATKKDKTLQALMLNPVPKLTEAFAKLLRSQGQPVVLLLDTYEKSRLEVDEWLWRLVANQELGQSRLLVAGRDRLRNREAWRKLHQDRGWVVELPLERFDLAQTQAYLQELGRQDEAEVEQIYTVTKGLPYYLNWIREQWQKGRELDFSQGNQEIVGLLLQGLNREQQRLLEVAACFRQFQRQSLERVLAALGLDGEAAGELGPYEWLRRLDFVEGVQGQQRLDDVARDVFRRSLYEDDRELFERVQGAVAAEYRAVAARLVPESASYPARYTNPDWRAAMSGYLYHLLLAGGAEVQTIVQTHLLEARYFQVDGLVREPVQALGREFGTLEQHPLLGYRLQQWLSQIAPAVARGWAVLEEIPLDYALLLLLQLTKAEIDQAVQGCLQRPEQLRGLAQFAAWLYKAGRCLPSQQADYLKQAEAAAIALVDATEVEFSSELFLWGLGAQYLRLGRKEEAITSYDQAIEFKPDDHLAWYNRGYALDDLGRKEEAISSYDQAIEFKPDYDAAWYNRGVALSALGRKEEAITSYDQAIEFKPDYDAAWYNRGNALYALGRKEEAITSYDRAIEFKPDYHEAWNNRGVALSALGRKEEAISSYDKAIEFKPDYYRAWDNRGDVLKDLQRYEEAISSYDRAIAINPDYRFPWASRGFALMQLGQFEAAHASFDRAIELKSDYGSAWYNKACCYGLQQETDLAISTLQQAITLEAKCREVAQTDSDFDLIRDDPRFQALLASEQQE